MPDQKKTFTPNDWVFISTRDGKTENALYLGTVYKSTGRKTGGKAFAGHRVTVNYGLPGAYTTVHLDFMATRTGQLAFDARAASATHVPDVVRPFMERTVRSCQAEVPRLSITLHTVKENTEGWTVGPLGFCGDGRVFQNGCSRQQELQMRSWNAKGVYMRGVRKLSLGNIPGEASQAHQGSQRKSIKGEFPSVDLPLTANFNSVQFELQNVIAQPIKIGAAMAGAIPVLCSETKRDVLLSTLEGLDMAWMRQFGQGFKEIHKMITAIKIGAATAGVILVLCSQTKRDVLLLTLKGLGIAWMRPFGQGFKEIHKMITAIKIGAATAGVICVLCSQTKRDVLLLTLEGLGIAWMRPFGHDTKKFTYFNVDQKMGTAIKIGAATAGVIRVLCSQTKRNVLLLTLEGLYIAWMRPFGQDSKRFTYFNVDQKMITAIKIGAATAGVNLVLCSQTKRNLLLLTLEGLDIAWMRQFGQGFKEIHKMITAIKIGAATAGVIRVLCSQTKRDVLLLTFEGLGIAWTRRFGQVSNEIGVPYGVGP
ncbi:hypothetical protein DFH07DRAFT_947229 [Mycena maculata]|uniref:Uncharacterized protein n=1 Tax=Mycena maculata TaxID=230809 RepID=A0AAD7HF45_9AGAR|nr:hypothetical protein DFH07DRAFT_947229 [Mycena maculata]